jgi:predicted DNA-binding transcriptional regulator YafY
MNRMDRLFGLVVLLAARRRTRATDLAAAFDVSLRTIYRDIVALSEAGVPIVSLPGQGYEIVEGFFLPPLLFSVQEASALILGTRLLRSQATGSLVSSAELAMAKITAVLPASTRQEVDDVAGVIDFLTLRARFDLDDAHLATLQRAIRSRRLVRLRYHSLSSDETTERDVEPHRLTYSDGSWYLNGYCRLRQEPRSFRTSRIESLVLLPDAFDPPRATAEEAEAAKIEVRVRVDEQAIRWVRERQHYGIQSEAPADGDGPPGTLMIYQVDTVAELIPWLRTWGASIEVLSPPEIRETMRREALRIAEMLT